MLVLSRNVGEVVVLRDGEREIRVQLMNVRGGRVSIGFEADREVEIMREELLEPTEAA